MKKIVLYLLCFLLLLSSFQTNYAISDEELLQKAELIFTKVVKKDSEMKEKLIEKIEIAFGKSEKNTRISYILEEFLIIVQSIEVHSDISTIDYEDFKIDISKLRESWLTWYNDYRTSLGLEKYTYDSRLQTTAEEWTELAKNRGFISHERTIGDGFYNYPIIEQWFQDRGVACRVSGRTTSVENTGYYSYSCNDRECTDEALSALRETFDYYMSEKLYNGAHYQSIVSPYLQYMGLGISIASKGNGGTLYNTTHFCTEFE